MNSRLLIVSLLILCFAMPGCGKIIKRKIRRKLDVNVQVNHPGLQVKIIGFWDDGCAPCQRAKAQLRLANIQIQWIKTDCYNRGMVNQYKITKVPTFIITAGDVTVRTHNPATVIQFARRSPCDGKEGCCP